MASSSVLVGIALLLLVSHSVYCQQEWTTNRDVMDLAIGIHYNALTPWGDKTKLGVVVKIIKEMANEFELSATETRVAIVEFGTRDGTVLLKLEDGVTEEKVAEAVEKIGDSYTESINVDLGHVTQRTHQLANESDRVDVPKLVIIITTAEKEKIELQDVDFQINIGHGMVMRHRGHPLFLNTYDEASGADIIYMHQCGFFYDPADNMDKWITMAGASAASLIAKQVVDGTRSSLATCPYKKSSSSDCRPDKNNCVADVFYQNALNRNGLNPPRWQDVKRYCFTNGSTIGCPTGDWSKCNATCYENGTQIWIWRNVDQKMPKCDNVTQPRVCNIECTTAATTATTAEEVTDDPILIARLEKVCVYLGVCLLITTPIAVGLVLYALKLRREIKALQALASRISIDRALGGGSTLKQPEWTVFRPPELTTMPTDDLFKEYGAKKTNGGQPKSAESIKSLKALKSKKG